MSKYLIYLFPALMDIILGSVCYIPIIRLSQSHASPFVSTSIIPVWGIVYCISAWLLGRVITVKNSAWIIIFSGITMAVNCLGLIVFNSLNMQFVWVVLTGVSTACFFVPFQIFMKSVQGDGSTNLAKATGIYTLSWSVGMGTGPFIAAWVLPAYGWAACYKINIVLALATAAGIWLLRNHSSKKTIAEKLDECTAAPEIETAENPPHNSRLPDLAWLGWIIAGVGFAAASVVRSLFPDKATFLAIDETLKGIIVALVLYSQGICGLLLCSSKRWMYKTQGPIILGICGLAGCIGFGMENKIVFMIAAILFGIYSGGLSFLFVYYSLSHPTKSARYIAVNEIVVGVVSILAPLCAGAIAKYSSRDVPFFIFAFIIIAATLFQFIVMRRIKTTSY